MSEPLDTVPIEAYFKRAANVPLNWSDEFDRLVKEAFEHTPDEARLLASPEQASPRITWADISSYQQVVNSLYPYPVLAHRADWGGGTDTHAKSNWAYTEEHLSFGFGYIVWKPGQNSPILTRLKNTYGSKAPATFCPMVDMESAADFAGGGNHSTEANKFLDLLAAWTDSEKRIVGYANAYDWSENWPTRPGWLKRITASYGMKNPGTWGWQYYGGLNYPVAPGFATSCKPFGTNVDLNSYSGTLAQMKTDLGLSLELDEMTPAQIETAIVGAMNSPAGQAAIAKAVASPAAESIGGRTADRVTHYWETLFGGIPGYKSVAARQKAGVKIDRPEDAASVDSTLPEG